MSLRADLLILLSALLWGGEYVVVKDMVEYLPPNWINAFRFIAAGLLLFPMFPGRISRMSKTQLLAGILLGFFLFSGFTLHTIGIQYTTASKSGFITSSYVVMVPFVYWAIRRSFPGIKAVIAAFVCMAGIGFIAIDAGGWVINKGDVLTLLAAVCFCGSIIGFDYFAKRYDPVALTFVEMLSGGMMSLVPALIFESFPSGVHWGGIEIMQLLYLVLLGSLFCHLASNVAMKWAESSHASILWSLESIFALIFGINFLGEGLTMKIGLGFALIFASVLISEIGGTHKTEVS